MHAIDMHTDISLPSTRLAITKRQLFQELSASCRDAPPQRDPGVAWFAQI
jgi:hypothetical protein